MLRIGLKCSDPRDSQAPDPLRNLRLERGKILGGWRFLLGALIGDWGWGWNDDDDNGFGSTVRYAPGVTKVRYRKIIYLKKPKIEPEKQQKKPK